MDELESKLQKVLESIDSTFDVVIEESENESDNPDNKIITKIVLKNLKNDGSDFVENFCSLFGPLIEQLSNGEKELVYEEGKGLTIRKTS